LVSVEGGGEDRATYSACSELEPELASRAGFAGRKFDVEGGRGEVAREGGVEGGGGGRGREGGRDTVELEGADGEGASAATAAAAVVVAAAAAAAAAVAAGDFVPQLAESSC